MGGQSNEAEFDARSGKCSKARPKFTPTPQKLPLVDTMAGVELGAKKLEMDEADELRRKVCGVLKKAKLPRYNLTVSQRKALKELRIMDDVAILPADKGNATVVMDIKDYHTKLSGMLNSGTYGMLKTDPTQLHEGRITRALKKLERKDKLYRPGYTTC